MASRYNTEAHMAQDALNAWNGGACNPRGLARSLVDMIDTYCELRNTTAIGNAGPRPAPIAVLMGQLNHLLGLGNGDCPGFDTPSQAISLCLKLTGDTMYGDEFVTTSHEVK